MEDLWGDLRKIVGGCLEHFYRDLFRYVFFVDRICIGRIFSIQYSRNLLRCATLCMHAFHARQQDGELSPVRDCPGSK